MKRTASTLVRHITILIRLKRKSRLRRKGYGKCLSSRPDAFVSAYSVVSFVSFRHQGSLENLMGEHKYDEKLLRRFSAELNVTDLTPPGFIWHSRGDSVVPVENSIQLGMAMAVKNRPFELHIFPGGDHGAGVAFPDVMPKSGRR